jgi:hypothetical protein
MLTLSCKEERDTGVEEECVGSTNTTNRIADSIRSRRRQASTRLRQGSRIDQGEERDEKRREDVGKGMLGICTADLPELSLSRSTSLLLL